MINEINIADKTDPTKIHRWNDFLMKYPNVIEYVDPEEQETLMISFWVKDIESEYNKMITPIESPNSFGNPSNRYNDTTKLIPKMIVQYFIQTFFYFLPISRILTA